MIGSWGRCRRCARRLKPQSIRYRNGVQYGPTCFKKVAAKDQLSIFDFIPKRKRISKKGKVKELAKV